MCQSGFLFKILFIELISELNPSFSRLEEETSSEFWWTLKQGLYIQQHLSSWILSNCNFFLGENCVDYQSSMGKYSCKNDLMENWKSCQAGKHNKKYGWFTHIMEIPNITHLIFIKEKTYKLKVIFKLY